MRNRLPIFRLPILVSKPKICQFVKVKNSCLHFYALSVAQASAPPQEATKPVAESESNTSSISQPPTVSATSQGAAPAPASQLPAKPANTTQAPNGTSSLPVSKLPAVGSVLVLNVFPANLFSSHQRNPRATLNRASRGVEVIYEVEEVHISLPEEHPISEVEEAVHNVVDQP